MHFLTNTDYKILSNKQLMKKSFLLPKDQHLTVPMTDTLGMGMRLRVWGHLHQAQLMLPGAESKALKWRVFLPGLPTPHFPKYLSVFPELQE